MTDWGASGRVDAYELWAVDPFSLEETGRVDFEPAETSVTFAKDSETGASASIAVWADSWSMEGCSSLLRIKHTATVGAVTRAETLGTFFVKDPPAVERYGRWKQTLACYSTQLRYTGDVLCDDLSLARGAKCVPAAVSLARGVGGAPVVGLRATENDSGLTSAKLFRVGDSLSETMQTLLALAGCRMRADDDGSTVIERDLDATEVAPSHAFEDGSGCTCQDGAEWVYGDGDWHNRVVAMWSRDSLPDPDDGLGYCMRCVADLDRGHARSYENTGRRATYVLQLADACTAAELKERARRTLDGMACQPRYVTIDHVGIPGLRVRDTVTYRSGSACRTCEVDQLEIASLGPLMLTKSKLRVLE